MQWHRLAFGTGIYKSCSDAPASAPSCGNGGERLRVVAVVPFEEEDESPFVGLLQVEGA
jgi:hypothetical protein